MERALSCHSARLVPLVPVIRDALALARFGRTAMRGLWLVCGCARQ